MSDEQAIPEHPAPIGPPTLLPSGPAEHNAGRYGPTGLSERTIPPFAAERLPTGRRPFTAMVLTAVLFLLMASVLEAFWRINGQEPSVEDTPALWSLRRWSLPEETDDTLLLVGSSRTQSNYHPSVLQERLSNIKIIALPISGSGPLEIIEEVLANSDFSGRIIADAEPDILVRPISENAEETLKFWNDQFTPATAAEAFISRFLHGHLAMLDEGLSLREVVNRIRVGEFPPDPQGGIFFSTGLREGRYRTMAPERLASERYAVTQRIVDRLPELQAFGKSEAWANVMSRIKRADVELSRRGGKLILIHMPLGGQLRSEESAALPRERYWDPLPVEKLHYADDPILSVLVPPDNSHLDASDRNAFTSRLLDLLDERGYFDGTSQP